VWAYLDYAYLRMDTFLHDLMKPVNAVRDISDKNCRALEEYLDLLIRTFDIAKDATMLPIVLHQNNLLPMYEKWWLYTVQCTGSRLGSRLTRKYTTSWSRQRSRKYIWARYRLPHWPVRQQSAQPAGAAISAASRGSSHQDDSQKPNEAHGKPAASQARPKV
jgi:hypothetical protein